MHDVIITLSNSETECLHTDTARDIEVWLDIIDTQESFWWYTWLVFQVQYYDLL